MPNKKQPKEHTQMEPSLQMIVSGRTKSMRLLLSYSVGYHRQQQRVSMAPYQILIKQKMFDSPVPQLKKKRITIFICCFFQYACLHSCRSTWSYCSGLLTQNNNEEDASEQVDGFTKKYLGYINFSFLFVYGSAMLFLGQIGDKIGPKRFVLYGTFTTSALMLMLSLLFFIEKKHISMFMIIMIFNGVAQASAWPGLMAVMNNWQAKKTKVILMGYFAACTNIGNILGDFYAAILIEGLKLHVMSPILVSAVLLLAVSIVNIFVIEDETAKEWIARFRNSRTGSLIYKEDYAHYVSRTASLIDQSALVDKSLATVYRDTIGEPILLGPDPTALSPPKPPKKDSITMVSAWTLPNVAIYAFAFGCIKAVFYILAFWLPSYLKDQNLSGVAYIVQMIEWGTIPGGILICYAGEFWEKRASIIVPSLWLGTLVMVGINYLKHLGAAYILYYLLVFLTGVLIGGVYNNVSGAIVIELSNMKELKGNKKSTSTVTSVVMGYGAVFAALNQLIVPLVSDFLFLYCGLQAIFAGVLLIPLIINEIKRARESRKVDFTT